MPLLLLGIPAILGVGGLFIKTASDEAQQTAETTLPQVVLVAAAGLGIYAGFKMVQKWK